jgi:hypothetical protein
VKSSLVDARGRDTAQAASNLDTDADSSQKILAAESMSLAAGERRRNDDGTGVNRTALVGVVEVFTMRGDAVDQGSILHAKTRVVTDGGARARTVDRAKNCAHIVLSTRGHAQARNVEHQPRS